jgi:hypothetical protein
MSSKWFSQFDAQAGFPLYAGMSWPKIAPMTIAVAAICEGGKAVVIAADKMLCVNDRIPVEADCCKIVTISDKVVVAWAGNKDQAGIIFGRVKSRASKLGQVDASAALGLIAGERNSLHNEILEQKCQCYGSCYLHSGRFPSNISLCCSTRTLRCTRSGRRQRPACLTLVF